jgi:hypothetical protein
MKKWAILMIALVFLVGVVYANSGRESLKRPPQEIEMLSAYSDLETWAFRVRGSGGDVVWGVAETGVEQTEATALPYTAGTGWELTADTEGSFFTFDMAGLADSNVYTAVGAAGAGVTIILPVPTAAIEGRIYPIHKVDSGTTDAVLYAQGATIDSASGTTNIDMDALGDILWLKADYDSAVSWWIVNRYIH